MDTPNPCRLLSIGEFSAATQLSPKALRLYDEQRLLRPANIDAATGYRYYMGNRWNLLELFHHELSSALTDAKTRASTLAPTPVVH